MKISKKATLPIVLFAAVGLGIGCGGYEAPDPYEQTELPNSVLLDEGTEIKVTPTKRLSPIDENAGEVFAATLAEPIAEGDQVIAAKGSPVLGVVVLSEGPEDEPDRIGLRLTDLTAHGGQTVEITTDTVYEFGPSKPAGGESDTPPVIMTDEVLTFTLSEPVEVTYEIDTT